MLWSKDEDRNRVLHKGSYGGLCVCVLRRFTSELQKFNILKVLILLGFVPISCAKLLRKTLKKKRCHAKSVKKKNWREKKKVRTKSFRSHSLLNHGFPTDFFLFFFDFQTLRLTRYYSCIFWQPENTPPSLYNVHLYAAVWPLFSNQTSQSGVQHADL